MTLLPLFCAAVFFFFVTMYFITDTIRKTRRVKKFGKVAKGEYLSSIIIALGVYILICTVSKHGLDGYFAGYSPPIIFPVWAVGLVWGLVWGMMYLVFRRKLITQNQPRLEREAKSLLIMAKQKLTNISLDIHNSSESLVNECRKMLDAVEKVSREMLDAATNGVIREANAEASRLKKLAQNILKRAELTISARQSEVELKLMDMGDTPKAAKLKEETDAYCQNLLGMAKQEARELEEQANALINEAPAKAEALKKEAMACKKDAQAKAAEFIKQGVQRLKNNSEADVKALILELQTQIVKFDFNNGSVPKTYMEEVEKMERECDAVIDGICIEVPLAPWQEQEQET